MHITNEPAIFNDVPVHDQLRFCSTYCRYEEMFKAILLVTQCNINMMGGWKTNHMIDLTIVYDSYAQGANTLLEVEIFLKHPVWHCIALIGVTFQMVLNDVTYYDLSSCSVLVNEVINVAGALLTVKSNIKSSKLNKEMMICKSSGTNV